MLSKDAQLKILKALKVPQADIDAAMADGENDIAVPEVKVYTTDEWTQVETNLKESGKSTYIKAGKEIAIKELKEKAGLEFEGKDMDTFLNTYKEAVVKDAKLPADQAKQQWEVEKKALQDKITAAEQAVNTEKANRAAIERDAAWFQKFPADRSKGMPDSDRLLLLKAKLEVKEEDGKPAYFYKGQRLQDDKLNDLNEDSAIDYVFSKENWKGGEGGTPPAGNGGGDSERVPGFYSTIKEVKAAMDAKGINALTKEGKDFLKSAQEANPKIDVTIV